jgi:hypothetical protein
LEVRSEVAERKVVRRYLRARIGEMGRIQRREDANAKVDHVGILRDPEDSTARRDPNATALCGVFERVMVVKYIVLALCESLRTCTTMRDESWEQKKQNAGRLLSNRRPSKCVLF